MNIYFKVLISVIGIVLFVIAFREAVLWYKREVLDPVKKEQDDRIPFDCESLKK